MVMSKFGVTERDCPNGLWGVSPGVVSTMNGKRREAFELIAEMYDAEIDTHRIDGEPIVTFVLKDDDIRRIYMTLEDLVLFETVCGMAIAELGYPAPSPAHLGWVEPTDGMIEAGWVDKVAFILGNEKVESIMDEYRRDLAEEEEFIRQLAT
jgi:hypothetical protein